MPHRLSDTLYALATGEGVLLYTPIPDNIRYPDPYAPKMVLSAEEIRELHAYLVDRACPVCWDQIDGDQIICDACLTRAQDFSNGHSF